jgi:hypothetical protein
VRRDDQIGNVGREQGVAVRGRFLRQHVDSGAAQPAGAQRLRKRCAVHQRAARGVDE